MGGMELLRMQLHSVQKELAWVEGHIHRELQRANCIAKTVRGLKRYRQVLLWERKDLMMLLHGGAVVHVQPNAMDYVKKSAKEKTKSTGWMAFVNMVLQPELWSTGQKGLKPIQDEASTPLLQAATKSTSSARPDEFKPHWQ